MYKLFIVYHYSIILFAYLLMVLYRDKKTRTEKLSTENRLRRGTTNRVYVL